MVWSDMDGVDPQGILVSPRHLRTMYSCWRHYPDPLRLFERVPSLTWPRRCPFTSVTPSSTGATCSRP
jgi:hypothetical protein